jgi:hypothetical protein
MSSREIIVQDIVQLLTHADDPRFGLVSREPFDITQLSRQQFPAIYVSTADEQRRDLTQGARGGMREGRLEIQLIGYVSGTEIDSKRNDLIERVEEVLDFDRTRDGRAYSTQLMEILVDSTIVQPFGRVEMLIEVIYTYQRGVA